jgi:hypothetical protein
MLQYRTIAPAEENSYIDTRSTEYTDLIVVAPAQLKSTGLSVLNNVNVGGKLVISGQESLNNQFFSGIKELNVPTANVPITVLTFALDANPIQLPLCVDLRYFAKVATVRGIPQTNTSLFCKISLLLKSSSILVTLEKTVYVNNIKDDAASATLSFVDGSLKLSTQDYTTTNGTLFYNVWGVNVTGVA